MQAVTKFYNRGEGYGFLSLVDDDTNMIVGEFFFHRDGVIGSPPFKGCEVEFELDDDRRGTRGGLIGTRVRRLGYEPAPLAPLRTND